MKKIIQIFPLITLIACGSSGSEMKTKADFKQQQDSIATIESIKTTTAIATNSNSLEGEWYKDDAGSKLNIKLNEDKSLLNFKFQIVGTNKCDSYETSGVANYMHQEANAVVSEATWYSFTDQSNCTLEFDIKSNSVKATLSGDCGTSYGVNGCPWPEGTFKKVIIN